MQRSEAMKCVFFDEPGGIEVLRIVDIAVPTPAAREVLIRVHAAGVNRPDIAQRKGTYPPPPGASPILGLEVAGIVESVGVEVTNFKPGDRVCALTPGGGYAEYCVAPASHCLPVPKGLSFEESAGIPETFFTVWANVFQIGALKAGENLLVHGGSSGIGTTAIQLAKAFGATVFTTAGSEEKCNKCIELGASRAINYKEQDFAETVKDIDVVLDMVGGPYTQKNLDCMRKFGRLVQIAMLNGAQAQIHLPTIMQKRLTITGSTMRPRSVEEKAEIARELHRQVWPHLESGKIKVVIDSIYPISKVAEAHERLESSQHVGKIILSVCS
jgi:NADPH:quinone reductase